MFALLAIGVAVAAAPRGTWEAGPRLEEMRAEVAAEVEKYVEKLSFVKRGVTRWALNRATAPCVRVEIAEREGKIAVSCDDQKTAVAPADGQPVPFVGDDGRTLTLSHRTKDDGSLVQTFAGKQGTRTNRFVPATGGGLTVEVTVDSPRLDEPLQYLLRYEP